MRRPKAIVTAVTTIALVSATVYAATQLSLNEHIYLSLQTGAPAAPNLAHKSRIQRLTDGTLILVYADAVGSQYQAWDFTGDIQPARDIFVTWSKDNGVTWTAPQNISNGANQHDGQLYDPDGNGPDGIANTADDLAPQAFYGDVDKPNIFAPGLGNNVLVSWTSKYCPGRPLTSFAEYTAPYLSLTPGVIQVPFSCVYIARLQNTSNNVNLISVDQLTDGSRDAKNDVPRGGGGGLALTWQEDPLGLQPGEAEGPGEGGSGANVSHGTDIWYSWLANNAFTTGNWATPVAISNNASGNTGASRPNLFVGKHKNAPGAALTLLAYEERKGLGVIEGKYVIYHLFDYNAPIANDAGVILSDPIENSRRVRFVAKGSPGNRHGTRLIIFWKQGIEAQGGPSDIMGRVGYVPDITSWDPTVSGTKSYGWRPEDLIPPVVGSGDPVTALNNTPGLNFTSANLSDASTDNPLDDARAHRAIIVSDFIALGYTYTPDQAVARYSDLENYDFLVRTSFDGGQTWGPATNLSNLPKNRNVKEPRLMGTPSTVEDTCPDPSDPENQPNPEDCQNKPVFYAAWGVEVNQYEAVSEGSIDMDLYLTLSEDYGATYLPVVQVAQGTEDISMGGTRNGESQLRINPAGTQVYLTWMQTSNDGKEVAFVSGTPITTSYTYPETTDSNGLFGCTLNTRARFDPLLPLLVLFGLGYLGWRHRASLNGKPLQHVVPNTRNKNANAQTNI
jgi:hypothetical protein